MTKKAYDKIASALSELLAEVDLEQAYDQNACALDSAVTLNARIVLSELDKDPIEVGDEVRNHFVKQDGIVLCIDGPYAWVRDAECTRATWNLANLTKVGVNP